MGLTSGCHIILRAIVRERNGSQKSQKRLVVKTRNPGTIHPKFAAVCRTVIRLHYRTDIESTFQFSTLRCFARHLMQRNLFKGLTISASYCQAGQSCIPPMWGQYSNFICSKKGRKNNETKIYQNMIKL